MKKIILPLMIVYANLCFADEKVVNYNDFGPQSLIYEKLGMSWWQWQNTGGDEKHDFDVKVVVFWDQTLGDVKTKYPVNQMKLQDYRYITYREALTLLNSTINELNGIKLSIDKPQTVLYELCLARDGISCMKNLSQE